MDWIKNNSEKFALLLLSIALAAASACIFLGSQKFLKDFDAINAKPIESSNIKPLDTKALDGVQTSLQKPATWNVEKETGKLFVSQTYFLISGTLRPPVGDMFYQPVPNDWLTQHGLPLTDPDILDEDPDGDGFTVLDEYNADPKTDPSDKNSHPPYVTKLRLKEFKSIPFRLMFKARPDADTFQIDTIDVKQPTQFLKIGDKIEGTPFKIVKFEEKTFKDANDIDHDVSELTIQNTDKGFQVIMVLGKEANSPDSKATFKYLWDGSEFEKGLDGTFVLKPEADVTYKVIDIKEKEAKIQNLKTKEEITVPHL